MLPTGEFIALIKPSTVRSAATIKQSSGGRKQELRSPVFYKSNISIAFGG